MAEPAETSPIAPPSTSPAPSSSEEENAPVDDVEQESDPSTQSLPLNQSSEPPNQSPELPSTPPPASCTNVITQLRPFSDALFAFYRCYDDLQAHMDEIKSSIDFKLTSRVSHAGPQVEEMNPVVVPNESVPSTSSDPSKEVEPENGKSVRHASSEVESLCEELSSRGLRKYFVAHLLEQDKLREEVPKALKFASDPAKLILESAGRFFLQRSIAYAMNTSLTPAREVAVLMWECFLLMENENNAVRINKVVKEESENSAKAWRKRLITEGGLSKACEIEARGFLMFLGCFGVPGMFRFEEIRDLVNAANVKDILDVLKRSNLLMKKIKDTIDGLAKNNMGVDAVDLAYTFEVQDKITPETILAWFLRDAKDFWKRAKKSSRDAPGPMNEANKKLLAALRSLVKCAGSHDIDVAKLIPGWQVHEMISSTENSIAEFEKNKNEKALQKRRADEIDSSKYMESKRMRHSVHGLPLPGHTSSSDESPSLLHEAGLLLPETAISGGIGSSSALAHGDSLVDSSGHEISYCNHQHYALRGDVSYEEQVATYLFSGQPSSMGHTASYTTPASMEGIPGYPSSVGVSNRSTASDLYQFVEDVVENDPYNGSRVSGLVPSVVPAHHS